MKTLTFILLAISLNTLGQDLFLFGGYDDSDKPFFKEPKAMFLTASIATTAGYNYKYVRTDEFASLNAVQQQQETLKNYAIGGTISVAGFFIIEAIERTDIFKSKRPKKYKKHKSTIKFFNN